MLKNVITTTCMYGGYVESRYDRLFCESVVEPFVKLDVFSLGLWIFAF